MIYNINMPDEENIPLTTDPESFNNMSTDEVMLSLTDEQPRRKRGRPPKIPSSAPNSVVKTPGGSNKNKKHKKSKQRHSDESDNYDDSDSSSYSHATTSHSSSKPKTPLPRRDSISVIAPTLGTSATFANTPSLSRQVSTTSNSGFSLLRRSSARRTRAVDIATELIVFMPGDDPYSRVPLDAQETIEFQVLMENPMEAGYYTDCDNTSDGHGHSHSHAPQNVSNRVVRELSNYFDGTVAGVNKPVSVATLQEVYVPSVTQRVTTQDVLVKLKPQFTAAGAITPPQMVLFNPPVASIPTPAFREVRPPPPPKTSKQLTMTQNANLAANGRIVKSGRGYISKAAAAALLEAAAAAGQAIEDPPVVESVVAAAGAVDNFNRIDLGLTLQLLEGTPLWPVSTVSNTEGDQVLANNHTTSASSSSSSVMTADIPAVVSSDAQDSSAMDVVVLVDDSLLSASEVVTTAGVVSATEHSSHDNHNDSTTTATTTNTLTLSATKTDPTSSSGRASGRVRKPVTPFSPCDYDEVPLTDEQLDAQRLAAPKAPVPLTAQQLEEAYLTELITRRRLEGYYRECPGSAALASSGIVAGVTVGGKYVSKALAAARIAQKIAASTATCAVSINSNIRPEDRPYLDYDADSDDELFVTSELAMSLEEASAYQGGGAGGGGGSPAASRVSRHASTASTSSKPPPPSTVPVISLRLFEVMMSSLERELELSKRVMKNSGPPGVGLGQAGFEAMELLEGYKHLADTQVKEVMRNASKFLIATGANPRPVASDVSGTSSAQKPPHRKTHRQHSNAEGSRDKRHFKYLHRILEQYEVEASRNDGMARQLKALPSGHNKGSSGNLVLNHFANSSSTSSGQESRLIPQQSDSALTASLVAANNTNNGGSNDNNANNSTNPECDTASKTSSIVCQTSGRSRSNSLDSVNNSNNNSDNDNNMSVSIANDQASIVSNSVTASVTTTAQMETNNNNSSSRSIQFNNTVSSSFPLIDSSINLSSSNVIPANTTNSSSNYMCTSDEESLGGGGQGRYSIGTGGYSKNLKNSKNKYTKVKKRPLSGAAAVASANALLRVEANTVLKLTGYEGREKNFKQNRARGHSNVSNSDKRRKKEKKADSTRLDPLEYPMYTVQQLGVLVTEKRAKALLGQVHTAFAKSAAADAFLVANTAAGTTPSTPGAVRKPVSSSSSSSSHVSGEADPALEPYLLKVWNYWRDKRSKSQSSFLRCYHNYMMDLWKQQDQVAVPVSGDYTIGSMRATLSRLKLIRADLEKYRNLADCVRRREKLKKEMLRHSGEVLDLQRQEMLLVAGSLEATDSQSETVQSAVDAASATSSAKSRISSRVKTSTVAGAALNASRGHASVDAPAAVVPIGSRFDTYSIYDEPLENTSHKSAAAFAAAVALQAAYESDVTLYSDSSDSSGDENRDDVHSDISCSDAEGGFGGRKSLQHTAVHATPFGNTDKLLSSLSAAGAHQPHTAAHLAGDTCSLSSSVFVSTCSGANGGVFPSLAAVSEQQHEENDEEGTDVMMDAVQSPPQSRHADSALSIDVELSGIHPSTHPSQSLADMFASVTSTTNPSDPALCLERSNSTQSLYWDPSAAISPVLSRVPSGSFPQDVDLLPNFDNGNVSSDQVVVDSTSASDLANTDTTAATAVTPGKQSKTPKTPSAQKTVRGAYKKKDKTPLTPAVAGTDLASPASAAAALAALESATKKSSRIGSKGYKSNYVVPPPVQSRAPSSNNLSVTAESTDQDNSAGLGSPLSSAVSESIRQGFAFDRAGPVITSTDLSVTINNIVDLCSSMESDAAGLTVQIENSSEPVSTEKKKRGPKKGSKHQSTLAAEAAGKAAFAIISASSLITANSVCVEGPVSEKKKRKSPVKKSTLLASSATLTADGSEQQQQQPFALVALDDNATTPAKKIRKRKATALDAVTEHVPVTDVSVAETTLEVAVMDLTDASNVVSAEPTVLHGAAAPPTSDSVSDFVNAAMASSTDEVEMEDTEQHVVKRVKTEDLITAAETVEVSNTGEPVHIVPPAAVIAPMSVAPLVVPSSAYHSSMSPPVPKAHSTAKPASVITSMVGVSSGSNAGRSLLSVPVYTPPIDTVVSSSTPVPAAVSAIIAKLSVAAASSVEVPQTPAGPPTLINPSNHKRVIAATTNDVVLSTVPVVSSSKMVVSSPNTASLTSSRLHTEQRDSHRHGSSSGDHHSHNVYLPLPKISSSGSVAGSIGSAGSNSNTAGSHRSSGSHRDWERGDQRDRKGGGGGGGKGRDVPTPYNNFGSASTSSAPGGGINKSYYSSSNLSAQGGSSRGGSETHSRSTSQQREGQSSGGDGDKSNHKNIGFRTTNKGGGKSGTDLSIYGPGASSGHSNDRSDRVRDSSSSHRRSRSRESGRDKDRGPRQQDGSRSREHSRETDRESSRSTVAVKDSLREVTSTGRASHRDAPKDPWGSTAQKDSAKSTFSTASREVNKDSSSGSSRPSSHRDAAVDPRLAQREAREALKDATRETDPFGRDSRSHQDVAKDANKSTSRDLTKESVSSTRTESTRDSLSGHHSSSTHSHRHSLGGSSKVLSTSSASRLTSVSDCSLHNLGTLKASPTKESHRPDRDRERDRDKDSLLTGGGGGGRVSLDKDMRRSSETDGRSGGDSTRKDSSSSSSHNSSSGKDASRVRDDKYHQHDSRSDSSRHDRKDQATPREGEARATRDREERKQKDPQSSRPSEQSKDKKESHTSSGSSSNINTDKNSNSNNKTDRSGPRDSHSAKDTSYNKSSSSKDNHDPTTTHNTRGSPHDTITASSRDSTGRGDRERDRDRGRDDDRRADKSISSSSSSSSSVVDRGQQSDSGSRSHKT